MTVEGWRKSIRLFIQLGRMECLDENSNVRWNRISRLWYIFHPIREFINSHFQNGGYHSPRNVVLSELVDSDDKKLCRGKTRHWVKRRMKRVIFLSLLLKFFTFLFHCIMCSLKAAPLTHFHYQSQTSCFLCVVMQSDAKRMFYFKQIWLFSRIWNSIKLFETPNLRKVRWNDIPNRSDITFVPFLLDEVGWKFCSETFDFSFF